VQFGTYSKPRAEGNISENDITSNNDIVNYFVNKGLTLNQAKGIYGNLM